MLDFITPVWLAALAAMAVPVLIHLWNRREGRVIRVGSTKLIQASIQRRVHRFRITEWPLLLVQLALLALLALLLARPVWRLSPGEEPAPGKWALLYPGLHPDSTTLFLVDSLEAKGYDLRMLAPGFPAYEEEISSPAGSVPVWSLLREADAMLPPGSQLTVVAPAYAVDFSGSRPALESELSWHSIQQGGENRWIQSARRIAGDSLQLTVGFSEANETSFDTFSLSPTEWSTIVSGEGLPPVEIVLENGESKIRLLTEDAVPEDNARRIDPVAPAFRALVAFDEGRSEDARYVRAALEAAADFLEVELALSESPDELLDTDAGNPPDLVFRLSDAPAPDELIRFVREGTVLIEDAPSTESHRVDSRIYLPGAAGRDLPRLRQRVDAIGTGVHEWTDEYGQVVMNWRNDGNGVRYAFFSRFNPAWTDLVHHPDWLDWMVNLVDESVGSEASVVARSDRRRLSLDQALPRQIETVDKSSTVESKPLHAVFWLLVAALFALEYRMGSRIFEKK